MSAWRSATRPETSTTTHGGALVDGHLLSRSHTSPTPPTIRSLLASENEPSPPPSPTPDSKANVGAIPGLWPPNRPEVRKREEVEEEVEFGTGVSSDVVTPLRRRSTR